MSIDKHITGEGPAAANDLTAAADDLTADQQSADELTTDTQTINFDSKLSPYSIQSIAEKVSELISKTDQTGMVPVSFEAYQDVSRAEVSLMPSTFNFNRVKSAEFTEKYLLSNATFHSLLPSLVPIEKLVSHAEEAVGRLPEIQSELNARASILRDCRALKDAYKVAPNTGTAQDFRDLIVASIDGILRQEPLHSWETKWTVEDALVLVDTRLKKCHAVLERAREGVEDTAPTSETPSSSNRAPHFTASNL